MMGKLRPQIFLAIVVLGILAAIGALKGVPGYSNYRWYNSIRDESARE